MQKTHPLKRFTRALLLLSVLTISLISALPIYAAFTTVNVSPSSITATVGQNFNINITISNVFDLYGWEFRLSWNTFLLNATNVIEGPFLKTHGTTFFDPTINNTAGYMVVDCTLLGLIPGVSGNGVLVTITFYVEAVGQCPLDLYDTLLLDSFERPIPISQVVDGYGYFNAPHDIAVLNVTAAPLAVPLGNSVNINVTVQNQGSFAETFNVTTYANLQIIQMKPVFLSSGSFTIVPFMWDTTGFGKGEYIILASASIVSGETDITDNNKTADNKVTILYAGHDVAVIGVKPFKTVVGQGYYVNIDVTVKNFGIFTESFETTVYAGSTAVQTKNAILQSGNSAKLVFTWNTTGWSKGNYTISAYAWPVSGETYTTDNNFTNGFVIVAMIGDITSIGGWPDGRCDMSDVYIVCKLFGVLYSNPKYNSNCDINNDLRIDMADIYVVAKNFGKIDP